MDYELRRYQNFNGQIHQVEFNDRDYWIGIGNLHEDVGMSVYHPQSGSNYIMIMLNNHNYRFHLNEFKSKVGLAYIAEKLFCNINEAEMVYDVIRHILIKNAAFSLLAEELDLRNPLLNDNIGF